MQQTLDYHDLPTPEPTPDTTTSCGSVPTSVHPLESPDVPFDALAVGENDARQYNFRHSSWAPARRRVHAALLRLTPSAIVPFARRDRFEDCGRRSWIMQHRGDPTHFKFVTDHCRDRFCEPCGQQRRNVIAENLARQLDDGPFRLLSLTLRHCRDPLAVQLDKLTRSFRKLRQRPFWKERVTGGCAFFEIKVSDNDGNWHPHLHAILSGRFLPQAMIKAAWLDITGDSYIVDIRPIANRNKAIWYCSKYATKPLPPSVVRRHPSLVEAVQALSGRKLIITFGPWSKWKLLDEPADDDWTIYCHVDEVINSVHGDLASSLALRAVWQRYAAGNGPADFHLDLPPPDD